MKRLRLLDAVLANQLQRSVSGMVQEAAQRAGDGQIGFCFQPEQDADREGKQRELVLKALRKAGAKGVTNSDLNGICFRYGARIYELRRAGHTITSVHEGHGLWRFTLTAPKNEEVISHDRSSCDAGPAAASAP